MFVATSEVLTSNESQFASYAALLASYNVLTVRVQKLLKLKQEQEMNRKGFATAKKQKRFAMAAAAMIVRGKVAAYAYAIGDLALFSEMKITQSKIKFNKSTSALTLSQAIYDAAVTVPAADKTAYDITPAMLTALQTAIADYTAVMVSPRVVEAERKSQTAAISSSVVYITSILKNEIDGLMQAYDGSTFYSNYKNARRVVEEATLQARVIGTVTAENGAAVEGAKVIMTDGLHTFEDITDENGHYRLRNLNPELYMFKVSKPGFTEYSIPDVDIYAGEHEKMDVKIKPVV